MHPRAAITLPVFALKFLPLRSTRCPLSIKIYRPLFSPRSPLPPSIPRTIPVPSPIPPCLPPISPRLSPNLSPCLSPTLPPCCSPPINSIRSHPPPIPPPCGLSLPPPSLPPHRLSSWPRPCIAQRWRPELGLRVSRPPGQSVHRCAEGWHQASQRESRASPPARWCPGSSRSDATVNAPAVHVSPLCHTINQSIKQSLIDLFLTAYQHKKVI